MIASTRRASQRARISLATATLVGDALGVLVRATMHVWAAVSYAAVQTGPEPTALPRKVTPARGTLRMAEFRATAATFSRGTSYKMMFVGLGIADLLLTLYALSAGTPPATEREARPRRGNHVEVFPRELTEPLCRTR